jgi:hypothetical protein
MYATVEFSIELIQNPYLILISITIWNQLETYAYKSFLKYLHYEWEETCYHLSFYLTSTQILCV